MSAAQLNYAGNTMHNYSLPSSTVPDVQLGFLVGDEIHQISARELFASGRSVVIGIPGAFTPVCSNQHIPDFVRHAQEFARAGIARMICIAPNDPFVLAAWAKQVDPDHRLRFYSDGNLEFVRALGVNCDIGSLFCGERGERYLMVVENGTIVRFRVETSILNYAIASATEAMAAADTLDISFL
ncbi:MAG: peroxiredoxin [Alphaproteobacteria bacterium]|nr:peroxiredoxin [Alphaproteobacteria bacterium]